MQLCIKQLIMNFNSVSVQSEDPAGRCQLSTKKTGQLARLISRLNPAPGSSKTNSSA